MASAVDSGRQRQLLQQSQALIADLKQLPLDPETNRASFGKVFELVRTFKRFQDVTSAMPPGDMKLMWEQRAAWVQDEVAALAAERIQASDHKVFWDNLYHVLLAAAHACDTALHEKDQAQHNLADCSQQLHEARARAAQLEQQLASAQNAPAQQGWSEDAFEMKSKLVVVQQELHKKSTEVSQMVQRLQFLEAEREGLQRRADELAGERQERSETEERQIEVIQQMMERHEDASQRLQAALQEAAGLQQHCRTLSVNLESNARVIEKLIELNSELMDSLNDKAFTAARLVAPASPQGTRTSAVGAGAGAPGGAVGVGNASGGLPGVGMRQPGAPGTANGGYGIGAVLDEEAGRGMGTPPGGGTGGGGLPPLPPLQLPEAVIRPSVSKSSLHKSQGGAESLTAAFSAFLMDPDSPRQATADTLAAPATSSQAGPRSQGGTGGVLSTARLLVSYVAGGGDGGSSVAPGPAVAGGPHRGQPPVATGAARLPV